MNSAKDKITAFMERENLTLESEFVPFSRSRNAAEKWQSLNWRVTLKRNGHAILTTDYSAGIAHCPGYKAAKRVPVEFQRITYRRPEGTKTPYPDGNWTRFETDAEALERFRKAIAAAECESGFEMEVNPYRGEPDFKPKRTRKPGDTHSTTTAIMPDPCDVLASLAMDSGVMESGGFEEWASDLGCDTDSRKAESTYRACLEIALKLRSGIGESAMTELRDIAAEY